MSEEKDMISPAEAKGKLQRAIQRLGISFLSLSHLVEYDEEAGTAYWAPKDETGYESIHLGPMIIAMDLPEIEMVLRHEFLHRASYNGFYERYPDHDLSNIVEDVCIHRLLYEAYPDEMTSLSEKIYPSEEKAGIIALADCSADPAKIPETWRDLWRYVWEADEFGTYREINPASLYYRLVDLKSRNQITINLAALPFPKGGGEAKGDQGEFPEEIPEKVQETLGDILGSMPGPSGGSTGKMMSDYIGIANPFGKEELADFMSRLRIDVIVNDITSELLRQHRYTLTQVYSMYPSRLGMVYLATGLTDKLSMYHNRYTETESNQLSLAMYVDVSGSMQSNLNIVYQFVQSVVEIPLELKVFSNEVTDVGAENFRKGKFHVGGGTDFNRVLKDLTENEEVEAGIMFTDGMADVEKGVGEKFEDSGKTLYVVYFTHNEREVARSSLNQYALDYVVFPPAEE